jgi:glycosyltransferase involved in cell wall biosynthesis
MLEENSPLVSVIMATFNEDPEIVGKAIESILKQSYSNFELIILDDSTNDLTKQKIDYYTNDKRVMIIREEKRMGFVPALNKGLNLSKGKYVARMDGDDISLPERFEKQVNFLEGNNDIFVLGGQINIINTKDEIISERKYPIGLKPIFKYEVFRCPIAHPTVMFRHELIDNGFKYDENLKRAEDLDLWMSIQQKGYRIENMSDKVLNYRVSGSLALKRGREQWKNNFKIRKRHFINSHFLFSLASCCVAFLYLLIPNCLFNAYYKKENKN